MTHKTPAVGRVCRSKAGRDKGIYYMITEVGEPFVYCVDGVLRSLKNPKKKRIKHLELTGDSLTGVAAKLAEGKKVFDAEIAGALRSLGYNTSRFKA